MAAKTWEQDFRYGGITASVGLVGPEYDDDPFSYPGSFCLPIAERPIIGITPGKVMIAAMFLGFALLIGAIMLISTVPDGKELDTWPSTIKLIVSCLIGLSGIGCFFVPLVFDGFLIGKMLGDRGHDLVARSSGSKLLSGELSDADVSKQTISIDGEDHVLVWVDQRNRRLLVEGLGARYQVLANDVTAFAPFQFMNYIGVDLTYKIGNTNQRVAIARVSLLYEFTRQMPLMGFLQRRIKNRLYDEIQKILPTDPLHA